MGGCVRYTRMLGSLTRCNGQVWRNIRGEMRSPSAIRIWARQRPLLRGRCTMYRSLYVPYSTGILRRLQVPFDTVSGTRTTRVC